MKLLTYIIGLLSAMTFGVGWIFTTLHWSGRTNLSFFGFCGFAFIFLPLLAIRYFSENTYRPLLQRVKFTIGVSSMMLVGLSGVFKVLQIQGAPALLMVGATSLIFVFLPLYFFHLYKSIP